MKIEVPILKRNRPLQGTTIKLIEEIGEITKALEEQVLSFNNDLAAAHEAAAKALGDKSPAPFPILEVFSNFEDRSSFDASFYWEFKLYWWVEDKDREWVSFDRYRPVNPSRRSDDTEFEEIPYFLPDLKTWQLRLFWKAERYAKELRKYFDRINRLGSVLERLGPIPGLDFYRNECLCYDDIDEIGDCVECTSVKGNDSFLISLWDSPFCHDPWVLESDNDAEPEDENRA